MKYVLTAFCLLAFTTAAQAQSAGSELSRQLRERQIIGMHTGAIPRPEGFTQEDLDAKYSRDLTAEAQAAARSRQWRRTHRAAAAAAKNHPAKPAAPVRQTTPSPGGQR